MSNRQDSGCQRPCCAKSTSNSSLRASIHDLLQQLQSRPQSGCCPPRQEPSWSNLLASVLPAWLTSPRRCPAKEPPPPCGRVECPPKPKPCASRPCTPKPCTRPCKSANTDSCCSGGSAGQKGSRVSSEHILSDCNFEDLPSERSYEFEKAATTCECSNLLKKQQLQKSLKDLNSESVCQYCNLSRCSTNSVCRKSLLSEAWGYLKRLVSEHKNRCKRCNKKQPCPEAQPCPNTVSPCKQTLLDQVRDFFIQSWSEHKETCEKCKQRQYCPNTKDKCITDILVDQAMVYILKKLSSCTKCDSVHQQVPQYTPPRKRAISCQRSSIKESVSECCEHCEQRGKSPCCKHSKWALERDILSEECCDSTTSSDIDTVPNKRKRKKSTDKGLHCKFATHSFQADFCPAQKCSVIATSVSCTPIKKCSQQVACELADFKSSSSCQTGPCERCPRDKNAKKRSDQNLSSRSGSKMQCCPAAPCAQPPPPCPPQHCPPPVCPPEEDPLPPCDCPPTSNKTKSGSRVSCACSSGPPQTCAPPPRLPSPCKPPPCSPPPCGPPPCKPPPCPPSPCGPPPCKPPPCPPPPCSNPPKPCSESCPSASKKRPEKCPALKSSSSSDLSDAPCSNLCNSSITSAHVICNIQRKEMTDEQFEAFLDEKFGRKAATKRHSKGTVCSDKSCECVVCNCPRWFDSSGNPDPRRFRFYY